MANLSLNVLNFRYGDVLYYGAGEPSVAPAQPSAQKEQSGRYRYSTSCCHVSTG